MPKEPPPVTAEEHVAEVSDFALSDKPEYPGQTMGVIALVLSFFLQLPALILGIIAWVWSNKAGISNVPAKVAVAVSAVLLVLGVLAFIGWAILVVSSIGGLAGLDVF
jgi:uncharacterized membrane protein